MTDVFRRYSTDSPPLLFYRRGLHEYDGLDMMGKDEQPGSQGVTDIMTTR